MIEGQISQNDDICILITSCDVFADLWHPFFILFFRYWPDCPYKIFLISNFLRYDDERVNTICIGEDKPWSANMKQVLARLPYDYILFLLDDELFTAKVDSLRVARYFEFMKKRRAPYFKLKPPCDTDLPDNGEIGTISRSYRYRASLQCAIWKRQLFHDLLVAEESAWQFERNGSSRSCKLPDEFLALVPGTTWPIPYFSTAVEKGRWLRGALRLCEREGIKIMSLRKQESVLHEKVRIAAFPSLIRIKRVIEKIINRRIYIKTP